MSDEVENETDKKMVHLVNKHIKITPLQNDKLVNLSKRSGLTQNEIVRSMLDNLDEVTFGMIRKETLQSQDKLFSAMNYWNLLSRNLTNNVNQISKFINQNHKLPSEFDEKLNQILVNQDSINRVVKKYYEHS